MIIENVLPTPSTELDTLIENFNSALNGPNWEALLYSISIGEQTTRDNAITAFAQLVMNSATGEFLNKKLNELNFADRLWNNDPALQKIGQILRNKKMLRQSFLEIIEAVYGTDTVSSYQRSNSTEPFSLKDGDTLRFSVTPTETVEVPFVASDFVDIAQATAMEAAVAINKYLSIRNIKAYAATYINPTISTTYAQLVLYAKAIGFDGNIQITGGTAQTAFRFDTLVANSSGGGQWTLTNTAQNTITYTLSAGSPPLNVGAIQVGNYVNVNLSAHAGNMGSFQVVSINIAPNPPTPTYAFSIINPVGVTETINEVSGNDLLFFNATTSRSTITVASVDINQVDVTIPPTAETLRGNGLAGYLNNNETLSISNFNSTNNTSAVFTVNSPALTPVIGDWVLVEDVSGKQDLNSHYPTANLSSSMTVLRSKYTTIPLDNGTVITVGGFDTTGQESSAIEKYDASTNRWTFLGKMTQARAFCAATLLPNNTIFISGGRVGGAIDGTYEVFDITTGISTPTASLHTARWHHNSILLPSGQILLVGGTSAQIYELYNPIGGVLTSTTLLDSAGLVSITPTNYYIPSGNNFSVGVGASATLVNNDVYVVGGGDMTLSGAWLSSFPCVFKYDSITNTWTAMSGISPHAISFHSTIYDPTDTAGPSLILAGGGDPLGGTYNQVLYKYIIALNAWASIYSTFVTYGIGGKLSKANCFKFFGKAYDTVYIYGGNYTNHTMTATTNVVKIYGINLTSGSIMDAVTCVNQHSGEYLLVHKHKTYLLGGINSSEFFPPADKPITHINNLYQVTDWIFPYLTVSTSSTFFNMGTAIVGKGTLIKAGPSAYGAYLGSTMAVTDLGNVFLTGTEQGMSTAQAAMDSIVAAGVNLNYKVLYPNDFGLGGSNQPIWDTRKPYDVGSVVYNLGTYYTAILAVPPGTPITDQIYWTVANTPKTSDIISIYARDGG
jgi:hypothetical protein